jgi:P-type conjugative transfer protein TrbG
LRRAFTAILLAGLPTLARAQTTQVPAIVHADAAASASATSGAGGPVPPANVGSVPATMPPPVRLVSPSAPLDAKERRAVSLAHQWASRNEMPHAGEDGVVRFLYGATLPTVVCAPLQVCDLALQPAEIVNNVNLGDKVRWNVSPGMSGSADGQVTHLIIKPSDAGLVSSMTIETNHRTYAIKLVSTQRSWMPLIAFTYPDDTKRQWSSYQQNLAGGATASALPTGENAANLDFDFHLSGDSPTWRPLRVYTDGTKTYIQFPSAVAFGSAPALVGLDNDGSLFSRPSQQMVNYRIAGDRYVVDRVLDHAALVSGVGGGQARVTITRDGAR